MAGNTALDVLVAEMLGDIGKLHDGIEGLKRRLPDQITEIEYMIGMLQKAGDGYVALIKQLTTAEIKGAQSQIRSDAAEIKWQLESLARDTAANMEDTADRLLVAVEKGVREETERHLQATQPTAPSSLKRIASGFLLSSLAGTFGGIASFLLLVAMRN